MKAKLSIGLAAAFLVVGTPIAQTVSAVFQDRPTLPPSALPNRPVPPAGARVSEPLPDLDQTTLQTFLTGRDDFEAVETPEGGLGPVFNGRSCVECHVAGGTGGAGNIAVTRFGRAVNGRFDPLENLGGSLLQRHAINPQTLERIPAEANVISQRITTPLFGAGLIEAIPDETILLNAQRRKPDGVLGRAARVTDVASGEQRVGRFGWKAQVATLQTFSADAYLNEMGITNRLFPNENAPNGNAALLARFDRVTAIEDPMDPATGKADFDKVTDFMRFLAPLPMARQSPSAAAGAQLFTQLQCAACHLPVMFTGPNAHPALANKPVPLFSDLLLHDMGALGDGIEQGAAKGTELRTAPLWGLRVRRSYLHDGRARNLGEAILAHEGEALPSRNRFAALGQLQRQQVIDYLNSL